MCWQCDCRSHRVLTVRLQVPVCVDIVTGNPIVYNVTAGPIMCWQCDCKSHHVLTGWLQVPFFVYSVSLTCFQYDCWSYRVFRQCDSKSHHMLTVWLQVPSCVDSVTANPVISLQREWSPIMLIVWLQVPSCADITIAGPIMCGQYDCESHYFSLFLYSVSEVPSCVDSVTANPIISHYFFTAWVKSHHVLTVWLQIPLFLIISLQREWSPIMCWQCDCKCRNVLPVRMVVVCYLAELDDGE